MHQKNYLNKHSNGNFILSEEERKEVSTRAGNKCKELGLGIHSMSAAEKSLAGLAANRTNKKNKTGIYSISKDDKIKIGEKCRDLGLGIHSVEAKNKRLVSSSKPWWNNGILSKKSDNYPGNGWVVGRLTKGRKWWNNGINEIMSVNQPDSSWNKGRLK